MLSHTRTCQRITGGRAACALAPRCCWSCGVCPRYAQKLSATTYPGDPAWHFDQARRDVPRHSTLDGKVVAHADTAEVRNLIHFLVPPGWRVHFDVAGADSLTAASFFHAETTRPTRAGSIVFQLGIERHLLSAQTAGVDRGRQCAMRQGCFIVALWMISGCGVLSEVRDDGYSPSSVRALATAPDVYDPPVYVRPRSVPPHPDSAA